VLPVHRRRDAVLRGQLQRVDHPQHLRRRSFYSFSCHPHSPLFSLVPFSQSLQITEAGHAPCSQS
jgi:hypothetical protein